MKLRKVRAFWTGGILLGVTHHASAQFLVPPGTPGGPIELSQGIQIYVQLGVFGLELFVTWGERHSPA